MKKKMAAILFLSFAGASNASASFEDWIAPKVGAAGEVAAATVRRALLSQVREGTLFQEVAQIPGRGATLISWRVERDDAGIHEVVEATRWGVRYTIRCIGLKGLSVEVAFPVAGAVRIPCDGDGRLAPGPGSSLTPEELASIQRTAQEFASFVLARFGILDNAGLATAVIHQP
jgi:hypothetical protein